MYLVQYNNTECLFDVGQKCGEIDTILEEDKFCSQTCEQ